MNAKQKQSIPSITASGIYMAFGGVDVLKDIHFDLYPGEIHALMGENGAGKSTLAKILAGVHQPRKGKILLQDSETVIPTPLDATKLGIALIHQEPLSFPDLNVAENIFVGRQPCQGNSFVINWGTIYERAEQLLQSLGLMIEPKTKMKDLTFADQQMVDIAAALSEDASILLMDEPTASLTPTEVDRLFRIMKTLRENGTAIVFVNHKLEEVFAISDRISVMRDGEMVGERKPENSSYNEIIKLMVGRDISTIFERPTNYEIGRTVLEVENLCKKGQCSEISFEVKAGEIVGMAGLVGAGRSEVAQAIFGVTEADAGTVYVDNEKAEITNPRDAIELGMAYVPEDRQHQGLFMNMSIVNNTTISTLDRFSSRGWVHEDNEQLSTAEYIDRLRIVLRNIYQPVRELSGGNQQKVVLSRWLLVQPKVIILDEPTRGIDIGAKAEVHRLMGELASRGLGILMISSELPEIVQMSDRVLVMHEGKLTANFGKEEIDSEKIMEAATGQVTAGSGTQ